MKNVVAGLVAEGEAVAVLLVFFQQAVVDDDSPRFGSNVLSPLVDGIEDRHLIGVVEYSHAEVDPIVGKKLVVRRHAQIAFDEAFDIHGGGVLQDFRLEIADELFAEGIQFLFTDNRNTVLLDSEGGSVHRQILPLSLLEFLYKPQPVSLACVQVTSGAQCCGNVIPFHDVFRKVRSDRVAHLASQIKHDSSLFVREEENLRDLIQLVHFGRITATLFDVAQVRSRHLKHLRHLAKGNLFSFALLLEELSKVLILCTHNCSPFLFKIALL